jgi:hypothetical protein
LKSPIDYLVDIGTDIAEYLAQIRMLVGNKHSHGSQYSQIRNQVATLLEQLNVWWQEWEPEYGQSAWEVPASPANTKVLFPTLLEYDKLCIAFTVSIYDMMRILLLQLWQRLRFSPNGLQTSKQIILDMPNRTVLLGISSDVQGLACEILRSLTYCYDKSPQLVGTFSFLFIQDVAYGCFDANSIEARWIFNHSWAKVAKSTDAGSANLLRRLLPLGQIRLDQE